MTATVHELYGEVVKLDRSFPLVCLNDGKESRLRCEHATDLKKHGSERAVIGDIVRVNVPEGHDVGVIEEICPRTTSLVRKDPTDRVLPQVLAANFDRVLIVQPCDGVNLKRLERELVLAHETGAKVTVILTKSDLVTEDECEQTRKRVQALTGTSVDVFTLSRNDNVSLERVRALLEAGTTSVMIGRSGAGKSTLVNALLGTDLRATSEVRSRDGRGRHKTVSREIMQIPKVNGCGGGKIVDMPGVRGLGLWDAEEGIGAAFSDIERLAENCKFRDCKHQNEPGCAVLAAVEDGTLDPERLRSYVDLQTELAKNTQRRVQSRWKNK